MLYGRTILGCEMRCKMLNAGSHLLTGVINGYGEQKYLGTIKREMQHTVILLG